MQVNRLEMHDFRGFEELRLEFHPRLNVLVGVNGIGKSSVLDCLAILLSRLTGRIVAAKGTGRLFTESDVRQGEKQTTCGVEITLEGAAYRWEAGKSILRGRKPTLSNQADIASLVSSIHERLDAEPDAGVPIAVLYSVNRLVDKVPLRVKKTHVFDQYAALHHSLTGKREEADFKLFFEWFRNREDLENEARRYLQDDFRPEDWEFPDRQLQAVRNALERLMPEFSDLQVRRKPKLRMIINKQGQEFQIERLSDGEKCLLALVGDMARRLAIANPALSDPLQGRGVFLIDEIDLHLHPAWQRMVIPRLLETFPNCQFIVTTHSPQVLGEVAHECIFVLTVDEQGKVVTHTPTRSLGLESSEVLTEILDAPERNVNAKRHLNEIFDLIFEGKLEQAQGEVEKARERFGDIPALYKAMTLIELG